VSLTSRERVRLALQHEEPDRVPIDFGATRTSGIAATAYRRLVEALGLAEPVRVYDVKQQLAQPSLEAIERMGGDVVQVTRLGPTTGMPFLEIDAWKPGRLTDGSPALVPRAFDPSQATDGALEIRRDGILYARRSLESSYFDVCPFPLAAAETPEDVGRFSWPDPWSAREEAWLRARVEELWNGTDKALFAGLPMLCSSFFELGAVLFGFERFLESLLLRRAMIERWLDLALAHHCAVAERFLAIAGPFIEAIQTSDDFGAQESLLISPGMYRELFKPRQARWVEFVKARTRAKVFLHCDGAVSAILPDFIEIGIDILNPVQTSATGMDPTRLKREYGRHLAFWGAGVDTQSTLPFGSVEEIRREVRERVAQLSPGGGFVFATVHNIQPDVSPDKILAVFETARECGAYGETRRAITGAAGTSTG
jgi:uroporphyrinogen decarboxylase